MPLNATQSEYLEALRSGTMDTTSVLNELGQVDLAAYANANFRELLFAIDATNLLGGNEWVVTFAQNLVDHTGWLVGDALDPAAYAEIGQLHEEYGRGDYGIRVVLDLTEKATNRPNNHLSFVRRTIRESFRGIRPMSEQLLFTIKRYYESLSDRSLQDVQLLLHIQEETKGLDNAIGFDRFFAKHVEKAVRDDIGYGKGRVKALINTALLDSDEVTSAECLAIKLLKDSGVSLDADLLSRIDTSRDRLMGMY